MEYTAYRCIKNKADSGKVVVELTEFLPFKKSRVNELLSNALAFNSYNALIAHLAKSDIYFRPEVVAHGIVEAAKEKFGEDLSHDDDGGSYFYTICEALVGMKELTSDFTKKLIVADFALTYDQDCLPDEVVLQNTSMPKEIDVCELLRTLGDKFAFDIDPEVFRFLTFSMVTNPSELGYEICVSTAESMIERFGVCAFLSSVHDGYGGDQGTTLCTGFGKLFILVDKSTTDEDLKSFKELIQGNHFYGRLDDNDEPTVFSILDFDLQDFELVPVNGNSVNVVKEPSVNLFYDSEGGIGELPCIAPQEIVDEWAPKVLKDKRYIGAGVYNKEYLAEGNQRLSFAVNLVSIDGRDVILCNIPSMAELAVYVGWGYRQNYLDVTNSLMKAFRNDEQLSKLDTVMKLGGMDVKPIRLDDETSIIPRSPSMMIHESMSRLPSNSFYYDANPSQFAKALKDCGVTSVAYKEVIEHDGGDMVGNCFVAYNRAGSILFMFEVYALYGYSEKYSDLINAMKSLSDGCVLKEVLEYEMSAKQYPELGGDGHYMIEIPEGAPNPSKDMNYVLFLSHLENNDEFGEPSPTMDIKEAINSVFRLGGAQGLGLNDWEAIGAVPIPCDVDDIRNMDRIIRNAMQEADVAGLDKGSMERLRSVLIEKIMMNPHRSFAHGFLVLTTDSNENMYEMLQMRNRLGYQAFVQRDNGNGDFYGYVQQTPPRDFSKLREYSGLPIHNLIYFDSQMGGAK